MSNTSSPSGPDFTEGVLLSELADGAMVAGHVGEEPVLLARRGDEFFAVGASCTHYGGPLAEGLMDGETVHCPWHHACFSLRTGEALHAPAFSPLACFAVERRGERIFVQNRKEEAKPQSRRAAKNEPEKIVIVGGGAAGFAAAEMLRREGWQGRLAMVSNDDAPPVDRPNLSKDYLAGSAPEEWIPLRPQSFYDDNAIGLRLDTEAAEIDVREREVVLSSGERLAYDRLLLATGAEPVRIPVPGATRDNFFLLRSLSDCRAIIARAEAAKRVVVLGASFIGLEVAASLRTRGLEVHVVAPEACPMERVLGPAMGEFVRSLHEDHGVVFHLEEVCSAIEGGQVLLRSGAKLPADFVVAGVGVRPRTSLAEKAGISIDRGVVVNEFLETNVPGIFAAGDIARWPDPHSGGRIRVEHWVVAERQGQVAARNMLGRQERYAAVPFFWSQHYDVPINYVGHAEQWDAIDMEGDIKARDCMLRFRRNGKVQAAASIYRDLESLHEELAMERSSA